MKSGPPPRAGSGQGSGPAPSHRAGPARQLGPYALKHELGRGSYGAVFLAQHTPSGNEVALKVLLGDQDKATVNRFRREASITARLQAPAIVRTLDVGFDGQYHYYAMDYVQGPTLKERLRQGPLPSLEAAAMVVKLAEAAAEAHQWGVIHRDLKPANVILSEPDGEPRITDFGLARDYAQERLTHTGEVMGTPAYMAPEQFRGDRGLDHRVDIYALGVILYQLLTGQRPYQGRNLPELQSMVEMGQAPPPRSLDPNIPKALEAACLRAMDPDPNKRFLTASAFAAALTAATQGKAAPRRGRSARTARAPRPASPSPIAASQQPPALTWGGWAAAGVLLCLVLWQALSGGEPPPPPVDPGPTRAEQLAAALEEIETLRSEQVPAQTLARHLTSAVELCDDEVQAAELNAERRSLLEGLKRIKALEDLVERLAAGNAEQAKPKSLEEIAKVIREADLSTLPGPLADRVQEALTVQQVRVEVHRALDAMHATANPMEARDLSINYYMFGERIRHKFPEVYEEAMTEILVLLKKWQHGPMPGAKPMMLILRGLTLTRLRRPGDAKVVYDEVKTHPPHIVQAVLKQFFSQSPVFNQQELLAMQRQVLGGR